MENVVFSGLGRTGDMHTWAREACTSAKGAGLLERKQARACRATPDVMPALVQAAKDTSTVCQQAFRHRRWNCSSIERAPDYTSELLTGLFAKLHIIFLIHYSLRKFYTFFVPYKIYTVVFSLSELIIKKYCII